MLQPRLVLDRNTRGEKAWLRLQAQQLKTLGLTVRHHPGYTLSPPRHARLGLLRRAASDDPHSAPPAPAPGRRTC